MAIGTRALCLLLAILGLTLSPSLGAESRIVPIATDKDCSGVSPLSRFPFITVAEFAARTNLSKDYWRKASTLTAHRLNSIRICFNKDELANDGQFAQGTISLSATLGDRAVEVDGYSEVGKPQTLRSATFKNDLAALILIKPTVDTLIKEGEIMMEFSRTPTPGQKYRDPSEYIETARNVNALLDALMSAPANARTFSRVLGASLVIIERDRTRIKDGIAQYDDGRAAEVKERERLLPLLQKAQDELRDAEAAVRVAEERHADAKQLRDSIADTDPNAATLRAGINATLTDLFKAVRAAQQDAQAKGVAVDRAFNALQAATIKEQDRIRAAAASVRGSVRDLMNHLNLRPSIEQYRDELLRYAGGVEDGEIFLSKQDAKAGDILRIYLLHYENATGAEDEEEAVTLKPQQHMLAEIYIGDFGYHRNVLDSFLLVKRLVEPETTEGSGEEAEASPSPSNFKGTGGVSLLWSKSARPHETRIWRVLSPSWGVNVSYLDFDNSKEIEIGAGLVAGLFDNQLHFGCGWNLNVTGNRDYCFIGFSFAAIEKKLAGNGDIPAEPEQP